MGPASDRGSRWSQLLIALNTTPDVNRATLCRLGLDDEWLRRRGQGRPKGIERIGSATLGRARERLRRPEDIADSELARAREVGARIVTRLDPGYPAALRELSEPPPVLYCRGELPDRPGVALVGSRHADPYGLEVAESFARRLAGLGLVIVSGLARGVDSAAHRGALDAEGGLTLAVLGCGIDVAYPRGSERLAERISRAGAVVSEFPLGTPPQPLNFPMRNRIIAALAIGTFVVRATARSGSLITARLALELGRDVYALPGNIFEGRSIGPNTLIRDGALPVQHPREIVESLPFSVRERLLRAADEAGDSADESRAPPVAHLSTHIKSVYDHLSAGEPRTAEAIAARVQRPVAEVLSALLQLEIGGHARRYPGPTFCRRS